MGRHADDARRRGVAGWPIVLVVAVLVAAGLITTYLILTREDPATSDAACVSTARIEIAAGPGAAPGMSAIVRSFNQTAPVARSVCLTAEVSAVRSDQAAALLVKNWQGAQTPPPTIWTPDNLGDVDEVAAQNGSVIAGLDRKAFATSPVVIAVKQADAALFALPGGKAISWSALPTANLVSTDGAALRLALPDPRSNRATSYALQSMIAPNQTAEASPVTVSAVVAAQEKIAAYAGSDLASLASGTTAEALAALADGTAEFGAVPVVESELALFNRSSPTPLTAVYPAGPTAGDYITSIGVTGDWITADGREAASAINSYLEQPAALSALVNSDLRVPSASGQSSAPGVDFTSTIETLPSAGMSVDKTLAATLGLPIEGGTSSSAADPTSAATEQGSAPATATVTETAIETETASVTETQTQTESDPPTGPATNATTDPATSAPNTEGSNSETTSAPETSAQPPAPPTGVYTLVVDSSQSTANDEDGRDKISWVRDALKARVEAGKGQAIGLWTISTDVAEDGYAETVATGRLTGKVGDTTRAAALETAIDAITPGGDRYSYAGIIAAYQSATSNVVGDVPNRVIAIVNGGDNTPNLPRADVVGAIASAAADNPGVTLDIIGIGADAPTSALTEVAAAGGGTYTEVGAAKDVEGVLASLMG